MATVTIPKILANFETSLAAKMSSSANSLTLDRSTDDDGNTLSGLYELTVDEGTSSEEHMYVTLTGASGSVLRRKLSRADGWTEVADNVFEHDRGASVKITNFSLILLTRLLNGDDTFNAVNWLGVNSISGLATPTSGESTKAANVGYVNAVAIAGGADASTTVKGISKLSTAPASATNPIAVGDNDPRVLTSGQATLVAAITADAAEINKLDGLTATQSQLNEAGTFFGSGVKTPVTATLYENINDNELVKFVSDSGTVKFAKVRGNGQNQSTTMSQNVSSIDAYGSSIIINAISASGSGYVKAGEVASKATTFGSEVSSFEGGASSLGSYGVFLMSSSLGIHYREAEATTPDTHTFERVAISGTTVTDPADSVSFQSDDSGMNFLKLNENQLVILYTNTGVKYRILDVSSGSLSLGAETTFTSGSDDPMFRLSDSRFFTYSSSNGFDVSSVSGGVITFVAGNSATGTQGWKFARTADSTGVLGYSDGTDYYIARLVESAGTITVSKATKILTSTTSVVGVHVDDFGQVIVVTTTAAYRYSEGSSAFALIDSYTSAISGFTPTQSFLMDDNSVLLSGSSTTTATVNVSYFDWKDAVGFLAESKLAGETGQLKNEWSHSALSGMTPGTKQYVQSDGTYGPTVTSEYLGRALSSTEIMLDVSSS